MSQKRVKKSRSFINTQNGTEEHSETPEMDVYSRILKAAARGQNLAPLLEELAQIPLEERYIWRVVSALKSVFEHYENACVWADLQTLGGMDLLRVECASRTATPFCRFLVTVCGSQPMEGTMSLAIGEAKFYNELTELARLATVGAADTDLQVNHGDGEHGGLSSAQGAPLRGSAELGRRNMKTQWNNARLQHLFDNYNQKFWRGKLRGYRVRINDLIGNWGVCDCKRRTILIDAAAHGSDREVRATVLHEMAHAAAPNHGHGYEFWGQLEMLLRKGAPVSISFAEAGAGMEVLHVAKRFKLCRELAARAQARRRRELKRQYP